MKSLLTNALRMVRDRRALAATEFAVIMPVMLVMFFGTVELSTGIAIDRKVTLVARTLSDVMSQTLPSANLSDTDLQGLFTAGSSIMYPYTSSSSASPLSVQISEIYVSSAKVATISWSRGGVVSPGALPQLVTMGASTHSAGDTVTALVPPTLLVAQTYLILSEVSYLYKPTIGYVVKTNITMGDVSYTRPRQATCIVYQSKPTLVGGVCPTP